MLYTPRFEFSRLEWLNKRGWKNFQDFMATYGYDPKSAADYMKAEELLCNYRGSDPFANKEEIDGVNDEDEGLEELEKLGEGSDEIDGMDGLHEGKDGEQGETLNDVMIDVKDVLEGYHDDSDGMEGNNERENEEERDEILDLMTDDHHDKNSILQLANKKDSNQSTESAAKTKEFTSGSSVTDGLALKTICTVGNSIKVDMRIEAGDICADIEEDTEEMDIEDDTRYEKERNREREALILISEVTIDEENFPRQTQPANFEGENPLENFLMTDIAGQVRNSREIKAWLIEQGYPNLFWFMQGHGLDFYDDELICVVGNQVKMIIEDGIQNGWEVLEQSFKELGIGDMRNLK